MSREIEDIPDRDQLVDAAFFDVGREPRMTGVRMMHRAVIVARADGIVCNMAVSLTCLFKYMTMFCACFDMDQNGEMVARDVLLEM